MPFELVALLIRMRERAMLNIVSEMQPSKGREDVKLLQKIAAKFQPLASSFIFKHKESIFL